MINRTFFMSHCVWARDLRRAPKTVEPGYRLIGTIEQEDGFGDVEELVWEEYPEDVAAELNLLGYWREKLELVADVSGGISPGNEPFFWWAVIQLPTD